jgi:hypothetical protein
MTTVYARIQSDTMRKEWEKTTSKGIVRFNDGQPEYLDGKKALTVVNDTSFDPCACVRTGLTSRCPWAPAPRPTKSSAASSSCPASTASPTSSRLTTSLSRSVRAGGCR